MAVQLLDVFTEPQKVEDALHNLTDGSFVVIAVEVFDHPTAHFNSFQDCVIGPWILGEPDEVYAWLAEHGHEDFTQQYSNGYGG